MPFKPPSFKNYILLASCLTLTSIGQASLANSANSVPEQYSNQFNQARAQLHSGQAVKAYATLLPLEIKLAGYPDYDLLFGQSALVVGESTRAVMAFERCLAVSPQMGDCRLGLAQAHMSLGEVQNAKEELTYIQKSAPPEAIAKIVEQYLGELSGAHQRKSKLNAWAEIGLGYDDNINVAPSSSSIILPGGSFLPGAIYNTSTDESMFADARLGISYRTPVSKHWDMLMGAKIQGTFNLDAEDNSFFDEIGQASANFGAQANYGRQRLGLMAQVQNYRLSGESYRDLFGLTGQYSYMLAPSTQISSFVQYSRLDYEADLIDTDTVTAGASMAHSLMQNRMVVHGGLYLGFEDTVESLAPKDMNNTYFGLRTGGTWFWSQRLQTGLNLMAEQRQYDDGFWMFPALERKDTLFQANIDATYQLTRKLSFSTEYSYVNNDSNMPIRDYDRQIVRLGVHYDFF